jgi:hypothetical protein
LVTLASSKHCWFKCSSLSAEPAQACHLLQHDATLLTAGTLPTFVLLKCVIVECRALSSPYLAVLASANLYMQYYQIQRCVFLNAVQGREICHSHMRLHMLQDITQVGWLQLHALLLLTLPSFFIFKVE